MTLSARLGPGPRRTPWFDALTAAYGLGQRSPRLGDPVERARKTVTARIQDSIAHIHRRHPALGEHLATSVLTGIRCYRPADPTHWQL